MPLLAGNLKNVPMEEVITPNCCDIDVLKPLQNLRDEVAMDVDEDEDGTQRPKQVQDYGIEVDFAALDDEERAVSLRQVSQLLWMNSMVAEQQSGNPCRI